VFINLPVAFAPSLPGLRTETVRPSAEAAHGHIASGRRPFDWNKKWKMIFKKKVLKSDLGSRIHCSISFWALLERDKKSSISSERKTSETIVNSCTVIAIRASVLKKTKQIIIFFFYNKIYHLMSQEWIIKIKKLSVRF
jgi:hypothetical protein